MAKKGVRSFSREEKLSLVKRMLSGERTSDLARELKVKRTLLYKWKDIYRREGAEGLGRVRGRPAKSSSMAGGLGGSSELAIAQRRIAELERKVGQQQLDIDFFRQALRQVGAEQSSAPGAKPSTRSSKR